MQIGLLIKIDNLSWMPVYLSVQTYDKEPLPQSTIRLIILILLGLLH